MKILTYKFSQPNAWDFDEIKFHNFNLIVGRTGVGKTRLINTIDFLSKLFSLKGQDLSDGDWKVRFTLNNNTEYFYRLKVVDKLVEYEEVKKGRKIILKNKKGDVSIGRKTLPKLDRKSIALKTFSQDPLFRGINHGFRNIYLRRHNPGNLAIGSQSPVVHRGTLKTIKDQASFFDAYALHHGASVELGFYYLKNFKKDDCKDFISDLKSAFKDIEGLELKSLDKIPSLRVSGVNEMDVLSLCVKENGVWISRIEISSGMSRYLEALIDIYIPPKGSIIIYDEFENGLDPIIIGDLLEIYKEKITERQYIFTSHHPYLIKNISPRNWILLNREGYHVKNYPGVEIEKDEEIEGAFISLINDKRFRG